MKRYFMVFSFRLILASLKQLNHQITNDSLVKQKIIDFTLILLNSEVQKLIGKRPRPKLVGMLALYPQYMFYSISVSSVAARIS